MIMYGVLSRVFPWAPKDDASPSEHTVDTRKLTLRAVETVSGF